MYRTIIQNGTQVMVIHDMAPDPARKLTTGKINREPNSISSYSFEIYPDNIGYDAIHPYTTLVTVYNTARERTEFEGRVLKAYPEMDENGVVVKQVICEDQLGYLNDSIQPYVAMTHYEGDDNRTGLEEFIDVVLGNHNASVEPDKRVYRGSVTVNPFLYSDAVTKQLNYQTTWTALKEKLVDSFGGYLILRRTNGVLYLDYLAEAGATRGTTIELGKNMKSASREIDPTNVITRLYPLGAKITVINQQGQGEETEERVSIASVNDGIPYIESEDYVSAYGIIEGTFIWDDVTLPTNLLTKARSWMADNNGIYAGNRITALDLSLLGLDADDFVLYDRYPVRNALIGLNDTLQIVKQTIDTVQPEQSTFEMGDTVRRLSDAVIEGQIPVAGTNGRSSYTHIRYSANADGSNMTSVPTVSTLYIGMCETASPLAPTDHTLYTWSRYVGEQGVGIVSTTPYYAKGSNDTVKPSDPSLPDWTISAPTLSYGEYLWCAYLITYDNNTSAWTAPFSLRSADELIQASSEPDNPVNGTLWLDTSSQPYTLMRYDGSSWQIVADTTDQMNTVYDYIESTVAEARRETSSLSAYVQQNTVSTSTYNTFVDTLSTALELDASGAALIFSRIQEAISEVNGSVQTQRSEREKYIRFDDGDIELGEKGADTKLRLENDILGFYQNGVRIAYFNSGRLYVDNLEAITSLRLGQYAFLPNAGGGMSLKYVGA